MTMAEWKAFLSQHAVEVVPLPGLVGVLVDVRGEETLVQADAAAGYALVYLDVPLVGQAGSVPLVGQEKQGGGR